jgi:hypothetical protein
MLRAFNYFIWQCLATTLYTRKAVHLQQSLHETVQRLADKSHLLPHIINSWTAFLIMHNRVIDDFIKPFVFYPHDVRECKVPKNGGSRIFFRKFTCTKCFHG